jgi:predicted methyltransferase
MNAAVVAAVLLVIGIAAPAAAQSGQPPAAPRNQGRLFPPENLGLLEGPDRAVWQKPAEIMDALQIAEGSAVADIGPGAGWFTMRLAERVGPNGIVYARDVQREMVDAVRRRVSRAGFNNVLPAQSDYDDPKLPARSLDAVSLVDVYQEIENPVVYLRNVAAALKPNGRIGIVNYKPVPRGGPGPAVRIERSVVEADAKAAGLRVLSYQDVPPYMYLVVLGK